MLGLKARWGLAISSSIVLSCGGPTAAPILSWDCPAEWVPAARGGCAPALMVCGTEGAVEGVCDGLDLTVPGASTGLRRASDGVIEGAWPAADFIPDAGVGSCADGFEDDGRGGCGPVLATDCAADQEPLLGGGCTATGEDDCPVTPFADVSAELGGANAVYVLASADPATADGSEAHPFATLRAAYDRAGPNDFILLGDGVYRSLGTNGNEHVVGRCAARTILEGGDAPTRTPVFAVVGGSAEIRTLTLRGDYWGFVALMGATPTLRDVRIEGVPGRALLALDAGTDVTVEGGVLGVDRRIGRQTTTVEAQGGSHIVLRDLVLKGGFNVAAMASAADSRTELDGVVIEGLQPIDGVFSGAGLFVRSGGAVAGDRVLITGGPGRGVGALGEGSTLELSHSLIRDTAPSPGDIANGIGALVEEGATVTLTDVTITGGATAGAAALGAGAVLRVSRSTIRDVAVPSTGASSTCVAVLQGGSGDVSATQLERCADFGLGAADPGSSLSVSDSLVTEPIARPGATENFAGIGATAQRGGELHVSTSRFVACPTVGVVAVSAGASATVEDTVFDMLADDHPGSSGEGLVALGARVMASRVRVEHSLRAGLMVTEGGSAQVEDALVVHTDDSLDYTMGVGAEVANGSLTARRLVVVDAGSFGVYADGPAAQVELEDAFIEGLRGHPTLGYGMGLVSRAGAQITADRLGVRGARGAGVMALGAADGSADGERVALTDAYIAQVASSTIALASVDGMFLAMPSGDPVAYGLHAPSGASIEGRRVVLDGGGYGFFVSAGDLALTDAVVAQQLDGAGAQRAAHRLDLSNVSFVQNASDDVVETDTLPSGATLPPPTAVCPVPGGC